MIISYLKHHHSRFSFRVVAKYLITYWQALLIIIFLSPPIFSSEKKLLKYLNTHKKTIQQLELKSSDKYDRYLETLFKHFKEQNEQDSSLFDILLTGLDLHSGLEQLDKHLLRLFLMPSDYLLFYNVENKIPFLALEYLRKQIFQKKKIRKNKRPSKFTHNPNLPNHESVRHKTYKNQDNLTRGHLVRAFHYISRTKEKSYKKTFELTNVFPQYQSFNLGPWLKLENYITSLVEKKEKDLLVYSGTIQLNDKKLSDKISIPRFCYKIIIFVVNGEVDFDKSPPLAFIMENKKYQKSDWTKKHLKEYLVPIYLIEGLSNLELFPNYSKEKKKYFYNQSLNISNNQI